MNKFFENVGIIISAIIFLFLVSLVVAIPVYYLWNWLCPEIFSLKEINFWQSWGLCMLSNFLVKSSTATNKEQNVSK